MLIRDVAYGRLPKSRRVGLHVRFADWIDELPDGSEEFVEILAYHLEQACLVAREVGRSEVPPPVDRAVEALSKAGEKAERREGLREAHRFYSRALELIPDDELPDAARAPPPRARALVGLGELRAAGGGARVDRTRGGRARPRRAPLRGARRARQRRCEAGPGCARADPAHRRRGAGAATRRSTADNPGLARVGLVGGVLRRRRRRGAGREAERRHSSSPRPTAS